MERPLICATTRTLSAGEDPRRSDDGSRHEAHPATGRAGSMVALHFGNSLLRRKRRRYGRKAAFVNFTPVW